MDAWHDDEAEDAWSALLTLPPGYSDRLFARPAWHAKAACRGLPVDLFFPEKGDRPDEARRICSTCPVKASCLREALEADLVGVWGGTSKAQRRQLARQAA